MVVGIVIVIGIVVISSTGGISSISYASMTCDELKKEVSAVFSTLKDTTLAEAEDMEEQIDEQLELIAVAAQSKNC